MRIFLLVVGLIIASISLGYSQQSKLAEQYFKDREYEKAASIYEELVTKNRTQRLFFDRYVECLMLMEKYEECERAIEKRLKEFPDDTRLYVTYGQLLERLGNFEKADNMYDRAVKEMKPNRGSVITLGNTFNQLTKYDKAISVYEKGVKVTGDTLQFAYYMADLYGKLEETEKMIRYHLIGLEANPNRMTNLKRLFVQKLTDQDFLTLQEQLYIRIQEKPSQLVYPEFLLWTFLHQKDYYGAFRQARALDRKMDENGSRVFDIGQVALNAKEYDTAIEAFSYIIDNKSISYGLYVNAKEELLKAKRRKLYNTGEPSAEQLKDIESEYIAFLDEFGRNDLTAAFMLQLARFEAHYLQDMDKAIEIMNELIALPGIDKYTKANAKLDLGDWYLVKGERWEATLLYSQVDKDFPEGVLGEDARFRNAKLSYYVGDFDWAQEQFKVLKAATSKVISNDAIDLSVFITDNLGLDTTPEPLIMYATADLLFFQGQTDMAFQKLDELDQSYPGHKLRDDILYIKAQAWVDLKQYDRAIGAYEEIINNHSEEIRFDNAMYELAELYDYVLDDSQKALALYERLFVETTDSVFATEARKRYRTLRDGSESPEERFMKGLP